MQLLIVTGSSGGHIIPAKAVAQTWMDQGNHCHWIGRESCLEHQIATEMAIPFSSVDALNFRRIRMTNLLRSCIQLLRWIQSVKAILLKTKPDALFVTGSYMTIIPALLCWCYRIPVILHEQNAVMGYANKLLQYFAKSILSAYPLKGTILVGNPVLIGGRKPERENNLLIIGGSLGSQFLNEALPNLLVEYPHLQIKHICGKNGIDVKSAYGKNSAVEVINFSTDMSSLYRWADMVVCRAGAMTLSEVVSHHLPMLAVPLPTASQNHQYYNACYYEQQGALIQSTQDIKQFSQNLKHFITDPDLRENMIKVMENIQTPLAVKAITTEIKKVINE
ncbi:UDP-N-acetylglucosamine--N-acetylmuramyl-(pentapeptide) pyrophosphoryl-undecaprenol N-acetylglucosamine transferase [Gammaproteobacteria bacterium]|nr:UDP-N-acetylglucosamine--N-acetylmuramyl-(pentapeptide) pyrophosphoryl-undecaprenol N-acetylglucosamine transferase [Gammaproteobacteria bacterium]